MESDDGAVARVLLHIIKDLFRCDARTVIAGYNVPHYYPVLLAKREHLAYAHVTVRRSEKRAVDIFCSYTDIVEIMGGTEANTLYVVECVVSNKVAFFDYHFVYVGIFANIIADAKECGFDAIIVELIQNPWSDMGDRAVVEGKINASFVAGDGYPPYCSRE
jgi:hypothetical protein